MLFRSGVNEWLSVRPAIHSQKTCLQFKGERFLYYELRSGRNAYTSGVRVLVPSGGDSNNGVNGWLSVRPAIHLKNLLTISGGSFLYYEPALRRHS